MSFFDEGERRQLSRRAEIDRRKLQEVFESQSVYVKVKNWRVSPIGTFFYLDLKPSQPLKAVRALMDDINLHLSAARKSPVHARLSEAPFYIELPHKDPKPLNWDRDREFPSHSLFAGRGWGFSGGIDVLLDLDKSPHTLVSGQTGSGKSVLLLNMLFSIAGSTSPEELEILLVDLKNEDLVEPARLPHVRGFAGNPKDAIAMIKAVNTEVERRRDFGSKGKARLLLVIDELAQVPGKAVKFLEAITALGRSMRINVLSATQYPNKDTIGSKAAQVNYVARFVGKVSDGGTAATAAGIGGTGAERLPGLGSFIYAGGIETALRLQTLKIEKEEIPELVSLCAEKWGRIARAPEAGKIEAVGVAYGELERAFSVFYDGVGGLKRNGMAECIRIRFGEEASGSGRKYQEQRRAVMEDFKVWAETVGAAV